MITPGSRLACAIFPVFVAALVLVVCPPQAHPQDNTVHTPADFETALTKAKAGLDSAQKTLNDNRTLRDTAEAAANSLNGYTSTRETDASAVTVLTNIDKVLQGLFVKDRNGKQVGKVPDLLADATTTATTQKTNLQGPCGALKTLKEGDTNDFNSLSEDLHNRVMLTLSNCDTVDGQLGKEKDPNAASAESVQDALPKVVTRVIEVTKKLNDNLAKLAALPTEPPTTATDDVAKAKAEFTSTVLSATGRYLPVFAETVDFKDSYSAKWDDIAKDLNSLGFSSNVADVTTNLTTLARTICTITGKLQIWLDSVKQAPAIEAALLEQDTSDVDKDAPKYTASATEELRKAITMRDSAKSVEDAWGKLLPILDKLDSTCSPPEAIPASLREMTENSRVLFGALSRLQEAIAGDFSQFEADQQPLFYFTDVLRLMQMLNPGAYEIGGIKGAQEQAAVQRQKLAQAELDLAAAQADVNTYQTRLMQLPEELKQARADARKQDQAYGKTSNRLNLLTDQLSGATKQSSAVDTAAAAAPTDKQQQLAAQRAQQQKDRLASLNADAQRDNANALHDKDVADQKLKAAEDEQTGIPAQIEKAKLALQAAQNNVGQRRQESLLVAQAESDAFALARDNTPYWFAPASGISKDPARRVEMYGTNDSKIIYLRGKRADIDVVKNIISGIDRAAPQARVTLWSLQLNYTNDTKGHSARNVNQALVQVEDRLAAIRTRMAASVSLLRDFVNSSVNESVRESNCATADNCRVDRIRKFYDRQVLLRLGDTDPADQTGYFKSLSRWTVPDPAGTTTLGEALLILSLAKPNYRHEAFKKFVDAIQTRAKDDKWNIWHQDAVKHRSESEKVKFDKPFKSLSRVLNLDQALEKSSTETSEKNELTSAQLEILHALESVAYRRLVERVTSLSAQLKSKDIAIREACRKLSMLRTTDGKGRTADPCIAIETSCPDCPSLVEGKPKPCPCPPQAGDLLVDQIWAAQASIMSLSGEIAPLLWYLWQHYGSPPELVTSFPNAQSLSESIGTNASKRSQITAAATIEALLARQLMKEGRAREAAADEMLKEMMTAMEEDLDHNFIRFGLADLREDLMTDRNLQVGVLQRTSILATNRELARVDPRASAQLALGEQEDILQSVTQLAQIYMAAQTGGALGTLSALSNLKSQTKEPPQEIYGLTTGSAFKITPIFDPSGQALRFKFDYVAANNVTEPNGTTNPQLPRIERHTVNTEVQISNHELREISRFESNAKLGLPTKYWGGIPILKDIPYVRPVPLIGWFVRKGGSGAASQESLLFGQTTIYPTISDIVELLTGGVTAP